MDHPSVLSLGVWCRLLELKVDRLAEMMAELTRLVKEGEEGWRSPRMGRGRPT